MDKLENCKSIYWAKETSHALNYGTRGNIAYIELETKPGYEIYFTGTTKENESYLKVLSIRKIGGTEKDISGWEDEIGMK